MPSTDEGAANGARRLRPQPAELLQQWQRYFADPLLSLAALRAEAEQGVLFEKRGLRSLSWRFFLGLLPSPTPFPPSPASCESYELVLAQARTTHTALRERYLRSPDGRWVADGPDATSSSSEASSAHQGRQAKVEDLKVNNPLGLDEGNPWQEWFADLETRSEIRKDVLRTFPEVAYFRSAETQDRMTDLLFIWCKLNPEVGYRQGMHELVAPLLWFVDYDSLPSVPPDPSSDGAPGEPRDSLAYLVLAREWVEHDAWALFAALMQSAKVFYDHAPSVTLTPRSASNFHASTTPPTTSSTLVQPVVALASHLHSLLASVDPPLARVFTTFQVEPQLYAVRWFRLLFSREFPLSATLTLWDALFALDGSSLRLVTHIALALLLRARNALLHAAKDGDYGAFVQLLLRYPECRGGGFATALLVRQAAYLRDHCSGEGATHLRQENDALGMGIGESLTPEEEQEEIGPGAMAPAPYGGVRANGMASAHRRSKTVAPVNGLGFFGGEAGLAFGDLAKGVLARGEALGINKALRGTLDEIKRGVAEAQSLAEDRRRAAARLSPSSSEFSQIPQRSPWPVSVSPPPTSSGSYPDRSAPPPPVAAKDALADLEAMRRASAGMSAALARAVAVLEDAVDDGRREEPGVRAALDAIKHVGDVLGGRAEGFEAVVGPTKVAPATTNQKPSAQTHTVHKARGNEGGPPAQPVVDSTPSSAPRVVSPPLRAPGTSTVESALPSKYLGARTDKPLPSLSRTPQASSALPSPSSPPPPPAASQASLADRPVAAALAAVYPPSSVSAEPRTPSAAEPVPSSALPADELTDARPPAPPTSIDPLGVLSA